MRALLIYPDSPHELIGWGDLGAIAEPLALEYLAAGALQDGHEVRILDLRLHRDALTTTLKGFQPNVVGITGYSMHVLRNLAILREVKELLPNIVTVVGGHHATVMPEDFFELAFVDYVVSGEGVGPFREILRRLEEGARIITFPGVWVHDGLEFRFNGPSPPFDPDQLPLPARHVTEGDRSAYFIDWMQPIALLRSTVGCPYRCSFCSLWRVTEGRYYKRKVDRVMQELRQISEQFVFLIDDEAFVDHNFARALAKAIAEAGIQKRYFAYTRFDSFMRDRGTMAIWRKLGLDRLFIGIEAVTTEQLQSYNKRLTLSQIEAGYRQAAELGIEIFSGFIVHPSFKTADFTRLIRFIEHHKISYPSFTIWTPLPGTDALTPEFSGIIKRQSNGRPDWSLYDLQHPVVKTSLPKAEFINQYRNLQRVFASRITRYRDRRDAYRELPHGKQHTDARW